MLLADLRPSHIILYDPDLAVIRAIEGYHSTLAPPPPQAPAPQQTDADAADAATAAAAAPTTAVVGGARAKVRAA